MAQSGLKGYKGRGVVLHTIKYGENAMIVHMLTDVGGRQSFIVQGVRSSRGRGSKAALFQPLFTVEFEGLESSRTELHKFREVRSGITLRRTPFDVRRSTIALFIAEVLYRLVKESGRNETLFERVWHAIESLDTIEEGVANFHLWFLANLSRELGFTPSGRYSDGAWFDIREGSYTRFEPAGGYAMSRDESWLLNQMMTREVTQLGEVKISREQRVALLEALLKYYGYHLDEIHSVQSIAILRELF
ncbi:MAG: DNA repair protein RecO [Rikenellaceae bacterium]